MAQAIEHPKNSVAAFGPLRGLLVRAAALVVGSLALAGANAGAPYNPSTGEQRTVVLLVNFQNNPSMPFGIADARQAFFSTVDSYFREVSEGRTWLAGDVFGWLTLPVDATCDSSTIVASANQAATAQGIDLGAYGRRVYVYAGASGCMAAGASSITRYPSETLFNGSIAPALIAHELGHAMGLYHSLTLDCDGGTLSGTCSRLQDDAFDVMGSSRVLAYPNALHRERLGWLAATEVLAPGSDGTYTIAPYELRGTGLPRVLKIFKDFEPATGLPRWYYIEYRQALGSDASLAAEPGLVLGVQLRYGLAANDLYSSASSDLSSVLLDMTPNSSPILYDDRRDASLPVGGQFVDASGLSVKLLWADGSTAGLQLQGVMPPPGGSGSPGTGGNQGPVAVDDSAAVYPGYAVDVVVLANDSDPNGDRLSVTAVGQPSQGTVRVNSDGSITYTASKSARRSDAFAYTASDGQNTATATVTVAFLKTTTTSTGGGKGRK